MVERVPECLPLAQAPLSHHAAAVPAPQHAELWGRCSQVLAEHRNDIRRYLRQLHPSADAQYGIKPEAILADSPGPVTLSA